MTAPVRNPKPEQAEIAVWPPPFELGPKLTEAYVREARQLRADAVRRLLLRLRRAVWLAAR